MCRNSHPRLRHLARLSSSAKRKLLPLVALFDEAGRSVQIGLRADGPRTAAASFRGSQPAVRRARDFLTLQDLLGPRNLITMRRQTRFGSRLSRPCRCVVPVQPKNSSLWASWLANCGQAKSATCEPQFRGVFGQSGHLGVLGGDMARAMPRKHSRERAG